MTHARIQELEQVIADLIHQDSLVDKWSVLQTYVLVSAELERVSYAAFELSNDNSRLARMCQDLQERCNQYEHTLEQVRNTEDQIKQEHERNINHLNELIHQNDVLCDALGTIQFKSVNSQNSDDKINLLLAVNQKLEYDRQMLQQQYDQLGKQWMESEQEKKYLNDQLRDQKIEIDQVLSEMKDCEDLFRASIDQQNKKYSDLQSAYASLEAKHFDQSPALLAKVEETRQQNLWSERKIEELLKYNEELEKVLQQTQREMAQRIGDVQQKLDNERSQGVKQKKLQDIRLEEYRKEIDILRERDSQSKKQATENLAALEQASKHCRAQENLADQLKKQVEELLQQDSYSKKQAAEKLQALENDLSLKAQETNYLSRQIEQLKKQLSSEQQITQQEIQRLEKDCQVLQQNVKQSQQLSRQLQVRIDELEPQLVNVTNERDQMTLRMRLLKSKEEDNEHLLQQVQQLRQDNGKLKQVAIDLTDSITSQKNLFHQQQMELIGCRDQVAQLQDQRAKNDKSQAEWKMQLKEELSIKSALTGDLKAAQDEIYKISQWNQILHEQVDDLRFRNQHLNSLLQDRENLRPDPYERKSPFTKKYY